MRNVFSLCAVLELLLLQVAELPCIMPHAGTYRDHLVIWSVDVFIIHLSQISYVYLYWFISY
jgi:hypothetical protein